MAGKYSLLTVLTLNATGYDQGINRAKQSTKDLIKTTEGISSSVKTIAGLGIAALGVSTAMDGFKKVMESTDITGDMYAKMMEQGKAVTDTFFRTIANGDWGNFFTNMDRAIQAGKDYAEAMDYIENKQRGIDISNSEDKATIAQLRLDLIEAKKKNNTIKVKEILNTIDKIEQGMIDRNISIATKKYEAEIKNLTDRGIDSKTIIDFVRFNQTGELNDSKIQEYKKLKKDLREAELYSTNIQSYSSSIGAPRDDSNDLINNVKNKKDKLDNFLKENPLIVNFEYLLENANDVNFKNIAAAIIEKNDAITAGLTRERKPLMQSAQLDKSLESKDKKDIIETSKEYIDLTEQIKVKVNELDELNKQSSLTEKNKYNIAALGLSKEIELLQEKQQLLVDGGKKIVIKNPTVSSNKVDVTNKDDFEIEKLLKLAKAYKDLGTTQQKFFDSSKTGWGNIKSYFREVDNVAALTAVGLNGLSSAFQSLFSDSEAGFKDVVTSMLGSLNQIINMMLAEAIANVILHESKEGVPGLLIAGAIGIPLLMGLWSKIPAFENGGIVGGNSYSGDKILARVNSGEVIIPRSKSAELFNNYNTNIISERELIFKVRGTDLVAVQKNIERKNKSTK